MRRIVVALLSTLIWIAPAGAVPARTSEPTSLQAAVEWINNYRRKPDAAAVPAAVQALSRLGAFKEPEGAGVYVGFIAGILGGNPAQAETLIAKMIPPQPADHWVIVRAIAYSGTPDWKNLLRKFAARMPARQVLIDKYLDDKLPTLAQLKIEPAPTLMDRMRDELTIENLFERKKPPLKLEPSQVVLDALWGYYLATGSYGPVFRIVALLPWANDRDNAERAAVGGMAKYTLATNAARDPALLAMLKAARKAKQQPQDVVKGLDEVVDAAETADAGRIRKDAVAAIEIIKTKGPAYKREISTWAKVGQGAIAAGCVVAAVTGHIELGLPCVLGGGLSSAALYYWSDQ